MVRNRLLTGASATGTRVNVAGGYYAWSVYGTWDGPTAQLQWRPNDGGSTSLTSRLDGSFE